MYVLLFDTDQTLSVSRTATSRKPNAQLKLMHCPTNVRADIIVVSANVLANELLNTQIRRYFHRQNRPYSGK
jgi:hypothetical protein